MPRFPFIAAALLLAATIAWALLVAAAGEPFATGSAALIAANAVLAAVVATAGMLLARSQWARRLALGLLAAELALLPALPADGGSTLVGAVAAVAALAVASPPLTHWVRRLPVAGGPPRRVVVLLLVLVLLPAVVGLSDPSGPSMAGWALAAAAPVLAWGYARSYAAALWALRLVLPVLGLAAAIGAGWPAGLAVMAVAAGATALAWLRDARLAAIPLAPPRVDTYRIPPELAPPEVLEAAGLDAHGRRRAGAPE